ncbi:MAG: hypothetical protein GXO45_05065 [Aquificae bacterium]|nr:hypothetical protein [Aquificota bacterium]
MEAVDQALARANMYGFLSRLFIEELDEETLNRIKQNKELLNLFERTKQWDSFFNKDPKKLIEEELNVDFTTVFLLNVYPYEAVFVHDEGHIDPTATNPTFLFYREYGYSIDLTKTRALSPDHLAIQMEFMMTLANEEAEKLKEQDYKGAEKVRQIQKEFLEKHLANWGTVYLLSAKDMAETPFYKDLCEIAMEFILSDHEYISETLEDGQED